MDSPYDPPDAEASKSPNSGDMTNLWGALGGTAPGAQEGAGFSDDSPMVTTQPLFAAVDQHHLDLPLGSPPIDDLSGLLGINFSMPLFQDDVLKTAPLAEAHHHQQPSLTGVSVIPPPSSPGSPASYAELLTALVNARESDRMELARLREDSELLQSRVSVLEARLAQLEGGAGQIERERSWGSEDSISDKTTAASASVGLRTPSGENRQQGVMWDSSPTEPGSAKKFEVQYPAHAVEILMKWIETNKTNPVPNRQQRDQLSQQTGLTSLQVSRWISQHSAAPPSKLQPSSSPSLPSPGQIQTSPSPASRKRATSEAANVTTPTKKRVAKRASGSVGSPVVMPSPLRNQGGLSSGGTARGGSTAGQGRKG